MPCFTSSDWESAQGVDEKTVSAPVGTMRVEDKQCKGVIQGRIQGGFHSLLETGQTFMLATRE